MDQTLFIALLNPAMSAVLAGSFLLLWVMQPQRRHVLALSCGYFASAAGFVLQGFDLGLGFSTARFLSIFLLFASMGVIGSVAIARRGLPIPIVPFAILAIAGLAVFSWYLFVEPNFAARVFAVSYSVGGMCLITAVRLASAKGGAFADRALMWLAWLRGGDLMFRPLVMALAGVGITVAPAPEDSAYWLSMSLSSVVFSLLIALALFAAVASDAISELSVESRTDPLSGLLNRRGFEEACTPHFRSPRRDLPLSLIIADLDRFKRINDIHGHATGDAVIVAFARLIRRACAGRAMAGRIGGEEFAILIPDSTLGSARLVAEGLRVALSAGALDGVPEAVGRITCSFGVASGTAGILPETLYKVADAALLQAKRDGRDRVHFADAKLAMPPLRQAAV